MTAPLLFVVPARGGSVRIPGKNLRMVAGMPLVARAIWIARRAAARVPGGPHPVVCSTDDPEIAAVARAWGATVVDRPAALATASASSADVAVDALDQVLAGGGRGDDAFRAVVLVQPTSPLTDPDDIRGAVALHDGSGGRAVIGVTSSHPAGWHLIETGRRSSDRPTDAGTVAGIRLSDAAGTASIPSGAVDVIAPADLRRERRFIIAGALPFPIPRERSVDIDEPADLLLAEALAVARPVRSFDVAGHEVGGAATFVIAEAGVNHDGRVEAAHRLVDAAADAGADSVKFQTFDPAALAAAGAPTADYQRDAVGPDADQRAMLMGLALPVDAWPGLRDHARDRGLVFLSTPFDDPSADLLDALGVPAFKVASGELTNLPMLAALAARGRPMFVSTGMADIREVADAVDAIAATRPSGADAPPVALLHCVSSYPASPDDANLRAMATLRAAFGVPVGWSDHTPGTEIALAAVAMGAALVEKHLTLDRTAAGPDHASSLEPDAFRSMVAGIRTIEAALGSGEKRPVAAERAIAAVARKSLHWRHAIAAGEQIAADDIAAQRPGTGVSPARAGDLIGRSTARAVEAGRPVAEEDVRW